jgi:hypothetical protein
MSGAAERPELSDSRPTATPADTTRSGTATPPRNGEAGRLFAPVTWFGVRVIKSQSTKLPLPPVALERAQPQRNRISATVRTRPQNRALVEPRLQRREP